MRTMTAIELSDRELRLAKANVAYALENCPVEGGIMTEAGHFSTKQSFEALLKKLQTVAVKPLNRLDVNNEQLEFLVAAATYALEYCPVEGGMMTEDNRFSTKNDFAALREKLKTSTGTPTQ
jgi:rRNA maturation protein Nop10